MLWCHRRTSHIPINYLPEVEVDWLCLPCVLPLWRARRCSSSAVWYFFCPRPPLAGVYLRTWGWARSTWLCPFPADRRRSRFPAFWWNRPRTPPRWSCRAGSCLRSDGRWWECRDLDTRYVRTLRLKLQKKEEKGGWVGQGRGKKQQTCRLHGEMGT